MFELSVAVLGPLVCFDGQVGEYLTLLRWCPGLSDIGLSLNAS